MDDEPDAVDAVLALEMSRVWNAGASGNSSGVRSSVSEEASDMATSASVLIELGNWKRLGRFAFCVEKEEVSICVEMKCGECGLLTV